MGFISRFWELLSSWRWGRKPFVKEQLSAPIPRPRRPRRPAPEVYGSFVFRGAILDQLDHYFLVLARMKKADRQSYDLFSRIGAHVVPRNSAHFLKERPTHLPAWWHQTLPARGGVFFGDSKMQKKESETDISYPRALHFQKYRPRGVPVEVQPVNSGAIYSMAVYWDRTGDSKWGRTGAVTQYPVAIDEEGGVRVLKLLHTKYIPMWGKKGFERGRFSIPIRRWAIPDLYKDWASQHHEQAEDYLRHLFIYVAEEYMMANAAMTRVAVTRGHLTGVFSVDIERTPYFFKDREVTVNEAGNRKRIFHIVRAHERTTSSGKRAVRLHFRGERQFNWNSYSISITVPGWHHLDIAELDIGAYDGESDEGKELLAKGEVGLTSKEFGKRIASWISDGIGGKRRRG